MTAVRFASRGYDTTVQFAYNPAVVDLLKSTVPGYARKWVAERKHWEIDNVWVESLAAALQAAGHTVAGAGQRQQTRRQAETTLWATALFSRLTVEMRQPVYRALSRCLHPDVGGDAALQRELNDGYSQAKGTT